MSGSVASRAGIAVGAQARRNILLRLLPPSVWAKWLADAVMVELRAGETLQHPAAVLHHVYFPVTAVASVMQVLGDGDGAQIAIIGREGVIGAPSHLGLNASGTSVLVQCSGLAVRVPVDLVAAEFASAPAFIELLLRHLQAVIAQVAQIAVCNRHHSPEQQLCRWLLMTLDRVDGNVVATTQELVAAMLGVRRETVSETARKLKARGAIEVRRGHVRVLYRPTVEEHACECYGAIRSEYTKLFSRLLPAT